MDDRDFYGIMVLLAGLSIIGILHSRAIRQLDDDIQFLMDHAVTRETEARP